MEQTVTLEELSSAAKGFLKSLEVKHTAIVIGLYGELGSGKTTFVQHVARALGIPQSVTSPTFVIERVYALRGLMQSSRRRAQTFSHLVHIDAYRLENSNELLHLGWDELIKNPKNLIFVEWAEKIEDILPSDTVKIAFEVIGEDTRKIIYGKK